MDIVSIISSVYSLAKGIYTWVEQQQEKDETVSQVSTTIIQITNVLSPLISFNSGSSKVVSTQVLDSIQRLYELLKTTQDHLHLWEHDRSHRLFTFLSPSVVIKQLKDDEQRLQQQLVILIAAISVVEHVSSASSDVLIPQSLHIASPSSDTESHSALEHIYHEDVKQFWTHFIGEKVPFVTNQRFCWCISRWLGRGLDSLECRRLIYYVDELELGNVVPWNLQRILGTWDMRSCIEDYMKDPKLPLLVWIDDIPSNNAGSVFYAQNMGVNVIQLTSTKMAQAWLAANIEFVRRNDNAASIRFVSDNVRWEDTSEGTRVENKTAGNDILKYLRQQLIVAPVLIYAGKSLHRTKYVETYQMAGSTKEENTYRRYVFALAKRRSGDLEWRKFCA
ncbi:hypothetical protein BDQ12DRAFT_736257 [Crucibulum laeve]|uniref:Uncharacterized protein n=1 Tax=Crucibulum laeve TaxID=68775 RepID=A0A5C3LYB7_9AGAR|nr:hypothetical protein BDQ12DRAFT_736257 [Crucibulum laeve]